MLSIQWLNRRPREHSPVTTFLRFTVGSGSAIAALNSTITATRKLYETLQETGRQAVEVTRSSFDVAAMAVPGTARRTTGPANEATK
jgi:hypothetical protein